MVKIYMDCIFCGVPAVVTYINAPHLFDCSSCGREFTKTQILEKVK